METTLSEPLCAYITQKTARNRFGNVSADVEDLHHSD